MEHPAFLDYVNYRRDKSLEALEEVPKLLKSGMLSTAMNRVYYAGFYIVSSLLLLENFSSSKHRQLIGYFNKNYVKTGMVPIEIAKILDESYSKRIASDYHDFVFLTKLQIQEYYEQMKVFVDHISNLINEKAKDIINPKQ